jgi:hypothetical protein
LPRTFQRWQVWGYLTGSGKFFAGKRRKTNLLYELFLVFSEDTKKITDLAVDIVIRFYW